MIVGFVFSFLVLWFAFFLQFFFVQKPAFMTNMLLKPFDVNARRSASWCNYGRLNLKWILGCVWVVVDWLIMTRRLIFMGFARGFGCSGSINRGGLWSGNGMLVNNCSRRLFSFSAFLHTNCSAYDSNKENYQFMIIATYCYFILMPNRKPAIY